MSYSYETVLIVGVPLVKRTFQSAINTSYSPTTGLPIREAVCGYEMVTASGVVYKDPSNEMDNDKDIDDWMNPDCGDFCYISGEMETHAVGVMIRKHSPKEDFAPKIIDWKNIPKYISDAEHRLESIGITDEVNLLIITQVI